MYMYEDEYVIVSDGDGHNFVIRYDGLNDWFDFIDKFDSMTWNGEYPDCVLYELNGPITNVVFSDFRIV